jgi:oligoribonuclease
MTDPHPPLIWIDMEMTGLEVETCTVLEIATIVTNASLEVLAEGPDLVIHQPDELLVAMDEWNTTTHGRTGLTEAVRRSTISIAEAEARTLEFLSAHCSPGKSPLCGNSIGQDRRFIDRYMPELGRFLHYRSVDVTTIKELARRWYPALTPPPKADGHRALEDIRASIEELRFYRARVFVPPT